MSIDQLLSTDHRLQETPVLSPMYSPNIPLNQTLPHYQPPKNLAVDVPSILTISLPQSTPVQTPITTPVKPQISSTYGPHITSTHRPHPAPQVTSNNHIIPTDRSHTSTVYRPPASSPYREPPSGSPCRSFTTMDRSGEIPGAMVKPDGIYMPAPPMQVLVVDDHHDHGPPVADANHVLFGVHPATLKCPYCSVKVTTAIESTLGVGVWVSVGALLLFGCCFCCCVPCCIEELKDHTHYCPSCKNVLGVKKPM